MKKILLFKLGAIGDVLMTTPFVRQLREGLGNEIYITYMVGKRSSEVLIGNPNIDEIITFDEDIFSKRDIWRWIKLIFRMKNLSKEYDVVIIFDKHWILNLTAFFGGFKRRIGFDRMGKEGKFLTNKLYWNASKREVEYYLDLLQFFDIKADYNSQTYDVLGGLLNNKISGSDISLYIKKIFEINELISAKGQTGRIIGISTGGGNQLTQDIHGTSDCRWWDIEKWETLVNSLLDKGERVILIGGKSDRKLNINHINFFDLLGKFSLLESIYLVNKCDYLICQDNGVMHFGGCANSTKIIALFGPTDPHTKYPFKNDKPAGIGWIWKEKRECYDCYGSYKNCKGDEIDKITVDEVLGVIKGYL